MQKINKVLEDIQEAQVEAGGRFIRQKELKEMTVEHLLNLMLPNEVEFKIKCLK